MRRHAIARAIAGAHWNPRDGLIGADQGLWLDPSDFSTMFQDSAGTNPVTAAGQTVNRINDKSGRGNHATNSSGTGPTLGYDSTNDLWYLSFNGTSQFLVTSSINFTATDKLGIFAGVRRNTTAGAIIAELSANYNTNAGSFYFGTGTNTSNLTGSGFQCTSRGAAAPAVAQTAITQATFTPPVKAVLSASHDISGDLSKIRGNKIAGATNGTADKGSGNFGNYPIYLGARGGSSLRLNGYVYQFIVVGRAVSADGIACCEDYVNMKTKAF